MQTNGLRPYLVEGAYYQAVEKMKHERGVAITTSMARDIRAKCVGLETASKPRDVTNALNNVFREYLNGEDLYPPTPVGKTNPEYMAYQEGFMRRAGLSGPVADGYKMLPISPYDPRFSGRSAFRQNGDGLLYVNVDDIDRFCDGNPARAADREAGFNLMLHKQTPDGAFEPANYNAGRNETVRLHMTSPDDISGMARLSAYMSENDYRKVRGHVNQIGMRGDIVTNPNAFMSDAAVDRAETILRYMQENGINYSVETDRMPGQIQAKIEGTKISVRLTDTRNNEQYVGRVYDDGVSINYSTTKRAQGGQYKVDSYTPNANECVDLLRFAMGEDIQTSVPSTYRNRSGKAAYQAFHTGNSFSYALRPIEPVRNGNMDVVRIYANGASRSSSTRYFTEEIAEQYLRTAIDSARTNMANQLDVERLIQEYHDNIDDIDYMPGFSGDSKIAAIQRQYWDVLTGAQDTLLRPGEDADAYYDMLEDGVLEMSEEKQEQLLRMAYDANLPKEEIIRQHAMDSVDHLIGQYEPAIDPGARIAFDEDGMKLPSLTRFNPVNVSTYMDSEYGQYRNNDDIVAAMKVLDISADDMRGHDFYNNVIRDKMLRFGDGSEPGKPNYRVMADIDDPFMKSMYEEIVGGIRRNGCEVNDRDILIDDNGVVHYTAQRHSKATVATKDASVTVQGEIGQIFSPGEYGAIITKYAGSENFMFVPGYEAHIVPQKPGENKTAEERTRLIGYEQLMRRQIRYQLHNDLLADVSTVPARDFTQMDENGRQVVISAPAYGATTSLNGVYRRLYSERHPVDFLDKSKEEGLSEDWCKAILETEARRVRYGNDIKEESTINADYQANNRAQFEDDASVVADKYNDNFANAYNLTGGRNMSIMTEEGDGYFDPVVTGTSTNQGITRYLVESAEVDHDGSIIRGELDDRCPLMKHPDCRYMRFNPFDRQQMTASNLMRASAITKPVNVAQMTFGGWTFDDPVVVSKKFAEEYQIRATDGEMRNLVIGDKISDLHGNKGVISLIVDPDMSAEEAKEKGLSEPVAWFKANPDLDVVMAPFPAVSRYNGGSARELMENPKDLMTPNGEVREGSIGEMKFIVTHMAVDAKTHIYDDDDLQAGKGRRASAQLAWAMASRDCPNIMREFYGANSSATSGLREMLIATGLDMGPTGELRVGYAPQTEDDKRQVFTMPDLAYRNDKLDINRMRKDFGTVVEQAGGILEMPFPIKLPSGEWTQPLNADKTDVICDPEEAAKLMGKPGTTYGLPVMSSYLRSGQEFEDGTSTVHDYTNQYLSIYEFACRYRDAQAKGENADDFRVRAQTTYDRITDDLISRKFTGKHNVFRDSIMGARQPRSATAVWTADPRLDVDQVGMGSVMMKSLGVKEDDYVLTWRDPILRDGGVRYMRVKENPDLTGIAVNPVIDKPFDGDFDGDSVGVCALSTPAAKKEAMDKFSVQANLLDYGSFKNGQYSLYIQNGLDMKVSQHYHPEMAERLSGIESEVNTFERQGVLGQIAKSDLDAKRKGALAALNSCVHESLDHQYGDAMGCYKDIQSHLGAIVHDCVETGAKGSMKKVDDYMHYLGAYGSAKDLSHVMDAGDTLATRKDSQDVQYATAVKAFGTGVAGMYSIRAMMALRNQCPKAALELTYPVTQSTLQSKHDAVDARHRYEFAMGPARDLWRGRLMEPTKNGTWSVVKDSSGKPVQATPAQWERQFNLMYMGKYGKETVPPGTQILGVDINPKYVREVSNTLTKDGAIMNIETSARDSYSVIMDKMAYAGNFDTLLQAARNHENVFDGKFNQGFAPSSIRANMDAVHENAAHGLDAGQSEAKKVKVISKSDVASLTAREKPAPWMAVKMPAALRDKPAASRKDFSADTYDLISESSGDELTDTEFGEQ